MAGGDWRQVGAASPSAAAAVGQARRWLAQRCWTGLLWCDSAAGTTGACGAAGASVAAALRNAARPAAPWPAPAGPGIAGARPRPWCESWSVVPPSGVRAGVRQQRACQRRAALQQWLCSRRLRRRSQICGHAAAAVWLSRFCGNRWLSATATCGHGRCDWRSRACTVRRASASTGGNGGGGSMKLDSRIAWCSFLLARRRRRHQCTASLRRRCGAGSGRTTGG